MMVPMDIMESVQFYYSRIFHTSKNTSDIVRAFFTAVAGNDVVIVVTGNDNVSVVVARSVNVQAIVLILYYNLLV